MNASFLRREWGAVTFVLTVLVGVIAVPLALYLNNQSPTPAVGSTSTPAASASPTTSPSPTISPSPTR